MMAALARTVAWLSQHWRQPGCCPCPPPQAARSALLASTHLGVLHLLQLRALAGQRLLELVQLGGARRQLGGQAVALLPRRRQVSTQLGGAPLCCLLQLGLQGVGSGAAASRHSHG
jgi:hypothetical protein